MEGNNNEICETLARTHVGHTDTGQVLQGHKVKLAIIACSILISINYSQEELVYSHSIYYSIVYLCIIFI